MCEVCGCGEKKILHHHHIVEHHSLGTNNDWDNLVVLCPTCHTFHHAGIINIIGVIESTAPTGRTIIYEKNGIRNIDIDPPKRHKVKGSRIYEDRTTDKRKISQSG